MKSKINIILLFLMLFQLEGSYSQQSCIAAGDRTLAHYTDLVPDGYISYGSPGVDYTFNLDINNDNTTDFVCITYWHYSSFLGYDGRFYIKGIGNNQVLVNPSDLSLSDSLKAGAPICDDAIWKPLGYFMRVWTSSNNNAGFDVPNRYVGLKIVNGVDSTFGWAQIFYNGGINIKDFGCDIFPPESGIVGYPNPTDDFINIYLPEYYNSPYELQLYNERGDLVYDNFGNEKKIDVHQMSSGIYFLRIITNDKTVTQKIMVKRKE